MIVNLSKNSSVGKALTLVLVAASAVLAFFDIEAILNIFLYFATLFRTDPEVVSVVVTPLVVLMAVVVLVFIILSFEYHLRHAGESASRRLLAISLGVLLTLFLVGYVGLGIMMR